MTRIYDADGLTLCVALNHTTRTKTLLGLGTDEPGSGVKVGSGLSATSVSPPRHLCDAFRVRPDGRDGEAGPVLRGEGGWSAQGPGPVPNDSEIEGECRPSQRDRRPWATFLAPLVRRGLPGPPAFRASGPGGPPERTPGGRHVMEPASPGPTQARGSPVVATSTSPHTLS